MPKLIPTATLSNYVKMNIQHYRIAQDTAALILNYGYRGQTYQYSIKIDRTACHYGGYRHWWLCPKCNRRVGVLYCAGIYVCRHCIGALYQTQTQGNYDRLFTKVHKIRMRLGWRAGIAHGHGTKPKGMHQSTYTRLKWQHDKIVDKICSIGYERIGITADKIARN